MYRYLSFWVEAKKKKHYKNLLKAMLYIYENKLPAIQFSTIKFKGKVSEKKVEIFNEIMQLYFKFQAQESIEQAGYNYDLSNLIFDDNFNEDIFDVGKELEFWYLFELENEETEVVDSQNKDYDFRCLKSDTKILSRMMTLNLNPYFMKNFDHSTLYYKIFVIN